MLVIAQPSQQLLSMVVVSELHDIELETKLVNAHSPGAF